MHVCKIFSIDEFQDFSDDDDPSSLTAGMDFDDLINTYICRKMQNDIYVEIEKIVYFERNNTHNMLVVFRESQIKKPAPTPPIDSDIKPWTPPVKPKRR